MFLSFEAQHVLAARVARYAFPMSSGSHVMHQGAEDQARFVHTLMDPEVTIRFAHEVQTSWKGNV
eukprot:4009622-Amphidinium_carterae.1